MASIPMPARNKPKEQAVSAKRHSICMVALTLLLCALLANGCTMPSSWFGGTHEEAAATPPEYTAWDAGAFPDYYRIAGSARFVSDLLAGKTAYGDLDAYGRATWAEAVVDYDTMTHGIARERSDMSALAPSGWGSNAEEDFPLANGGTYHGFFWNRSHLLAKSLGGCDELCNLITGTRMQNVGNNDGSGGMAYCETLCRAWLEEHPEGTLSYRATAAYEGSELVPRSVLVDMRSSDGTIDQRVEVFNAALGFSINYATGTYAKQDVAEDAHEPQPRADDTLVVVSASGKAYHRDASCRGLENANEDALRTITRDEAERMGRHPCGICYGNAE